jgi:inosine/xanthosine triphosphate pyrophosphatase family protein
MEIIFATNNENKTREIRNILGTSFKLLSLNDLNIIEEIPEDELHLKVMLFTKPVIYLKNSTEVFLLMTQDWR